MSHVPLSDGAELSIEDPRSAEREGCEPEGPATAAWFAVMSQPRHEKKIALHFAARAIEHFLPLYETVHRWKNQRKRLQLPLFPGYLFVRIARTDRLAVVQVPGVVAIVGPNGAGAPIPDDEVERIRHAVLRCGRLQPHPYLSEGHRVRITHGPFCGMDGVLLRADQRPRLVLSVHLIQRSVALEIDEADIAVA